jgi:hypothetical protein
MVRSSGTRFTRVRGPLSTYRSDTRPCMLAITNVESEVIGRGFTGHW